MSIFFAFLSFLLSIAIYRTIIRALSNRKQKKQQRFIQAYVLPKAVLAKVHIVYPHLKPSQLQQVAQGLQEYFLICNLANGRVIAMPSQVVDVAWHEFIICTHLY